ncbi:MAG TPA: hypothetical protein VEQ37_05420 [Actinomycetota bacterium]|nr:hypothetical protein [Actinomycetota bacterium]
MPFTRELEPSESTAVRPSPGLRGVAAAMAGPALIVGSVLVVLHSMVIGRAVPIQYGTDVLAYWAPNLCYLGRSLAAGHIPAWNPHVMGGLPFAADPGAGWLNLPAMLLFTVLPCAVALRTHIVLQPILAGLGLYWFLRSERLSRASATLGGLVVSVPVAASSLALSIGFTGSLAWTTFTIASASRFLRADRWSGRLLWAALTAVSWGQVAAAHAQWLAVATLGVLILVAVRVAADLRARRRPIGQAAAAAVILAAALPLVNLAYFLRLFYLSRSTLGLGYRSLTVLSLQLTGHIGDVMAAIRLHPSWGLRLALWPGMFVGAVALALVFAGWAARRLRTLAAAFALFGMVSYVLSVNEVAQGASSFLVRSALGTSYLHAPYRFASGVLIALAALAAIGMEAWLEAGGRALSRRILMLTPAVLVWGLLPVLLGATARSLIPLGIGAVLAAGALALSALRPSFAAALPLVLVVGSLIRPPGEDALGGRLSPIFPPSRKPVDLAAYVREGPIAKALSDHGRGRYLSLAPSVWTTTGYHLRWTEPYWGLMAQQRSMLFGLQEAQGYNSDQLTRYWMFVRAAEPKAIRYAAGFFVNPPRIALDLLQVNWAVGRSGRAPPIEGAVPVSTEGQWILYRLATQYPRVSVVGSWETAGSARDALTEVMDHNFDPAVHAILESDPGIVPHSSPSGPATAAYRAEGDQAARIEAQAPAPSVVLVRNVYDPGWHATVDGRPGRVMPANYLDQGIPIPAGRHTIVLSYDDPSVGLGLIGSVLALATLLGSALALGPRRPERQGRAGP